MFLVPPGLDKGQRAYSIYYQQCDFSNPVRPPTKNKCEVQTPHLDAGSALKYTNFKKTTLLIQENRAKMPFESTWRVNKAQHINTNKYGYIQAANSN